MTKNKKLSVVALSAMLGLGAVVGTSFGQKVVLNSAEGCAHSNVQFYAAVAPTNIKAGKHQHWACCDCGTRWTDEAKTNVTTNEALAIAQKTDYVDVDVADVTDEQMLYLNEAKLKALDQTTRQYVNIDGKLAARFSSGEHNYDAMDAKSYGATDFRFQLPAYTNIKTITFDYKLWDINYSEKDEAVAYTDSAHSADSKPATWKFNTKVHTETAYARVYADYINDNQWHTQTLEVDNRSIEFFQLMIYRFTGEMYVANVNFADETQAFADSLCKQTAWSNVNGGKNIVEGNRSLSLENTWEMNLSADWLATAKTKGDYLAFDITPSDNVKDVIVMNEHNFTTLVSVKSSKTTTVALKLADYTAVTLQGRNIRNNGLLNIGANLSVSNPRFVTEAKYNELVSALEAGIDFTAIGSSAADYSNIFTYEVMKPNGFDENGVIVSSVTTDGSLTINERAFRSLRARGYASFSFDMTFEEGAEVQTLCVIQRNLDGSTAYPGVYTKVGNTIHVSFGASVISAAKNVTLVTRDAAGYSSSRSPLNIPFTNARINNGVVSRASLLTNSVADVATIEVTGETEDSVSFRLTGLKCNYAYVGYDASYFISKGYTNCALTISGNADNAYTYSNSSLALGTGYNYGAAGNKIAAGGGYTVKDIAADKNVVGFMTCKEVTGDTNAAFGTIEVTFKFVNTTTKTGAKAVLDLAASYMNVITGIDEMTMSLMKTAEAYTFSAHFEMASIYGSSCAAGEIDTYRLVFIYTGCATIKAYWSQKNGFASTGGDWEIDMSSFILDGATKATTTVRCYHASEQGYASHTNEGSGCWGNLGQKVAVSNVQFK